MWQIVADLWSLSLVFDQIGIVLSLHQHVFHAFRVVGFLKKLKPDNEEIGTKSGKKKETFLEKGAKKLIKKLFSFVKFSSGLKQIAKQKY